MKDSYRIHSITGPHVHGVGSATGKIVARITFAGCNLWSGDESDRQSALCKVCDVKFTDSLHFSAEQIVKRLKRILPGGGWVVVTGGEPLLQFDSSLAIALRAADYKLILETNGTKADPTTGDDSNVHLSRFDLIICSPKVPRQDMRLRRCHDLVLLWPPTSKAMTPEQFRGFPAKRRFLQPVNDDDVNRDNLRSAVRKLGELNLDGDPWELSTQLDKLIGTP